MAELGIRIPLRMNLTKDCPTSSMNESAEAMVQCCAIN